MAEEPKEIKCEEELDPITQLHASIQDMKKELEALKKSNEMKDKQLIGVIESNKKLLNKMIVPEVDKPRVNVQDVILKNVLDKVLK